MTNQILRAPMGFDDKPTEPLFLIACVGVLVLIGSGLFTFDIADHFPAIYNPISLISDKTPIKPNDLGLNKDMAAIEVWPQKEESLRHHIFLPTILWHD